MYGSGIGKPRSRFGTYVDEKGIKHEDLVNESGASKNTVTKACSDDEAKLRTISKQALILATNRITGDEKTIEDFWPERNNSAPTRQS